MTEPLILLADNVRDLTESGIHIQPHRLWITTVNEATGRESVNDGLRFHRSQHRSLLSSLRTSIYDQAQTEIMALAGPARTVPHLNTDAIDRMHQITTDARAWLAAFDRDPGALAVDNLNRIGAELSQLFPVSLRPFGIVQAVNYLTVAATQIPTMAEYDIRGMVGIAATAEHDDRDQMCRDVARWRTWCRIFAGWESPAWRPNAHCPAKTWREGEHVLCDAPAGIVDDKPSGLRIRFETRSAVCLSCNATWGAPPLPSIETLGRHVAAEERAAITLAASMRTPDPGPRNRGGRS